MAWIGVLKHEKKAPQRISFDIELYVEPFEGKPDTLDSTVCYASVCGVIADCAQEKHFNLVETLAEKAAKAVLAYDTQIKGVQIILSKPDIMDNTRAVGVSMRRWR